MRDSDPYHNRLVKLPLPAEVVGEIDRLVVAGVGGYRDRNDFIRDAVSGLLSEIRCQAEGPTEPEATQAVVATHRHDPATPPLRQNFGALLGLQLAKPLVPIERSEYEAADVPLLGLHNRDFPSLWALSQIAKMTANGAVDMNECFDEVVSRAWTLGRQLLTQEQPGSARYSALFPTNRKKKEASEANFRAFAIGRIVGNGVKRAIGPLFQWRVCGVVGAGKGLKIGLLPAAEPLLGQLNGISANAPHTPEHTRAFFSHLRANARAEFGMFTLVLRCIASKPTREKLVDKIANFNSSWSRQEANSYAAGYVGRAREWGLVGPKMIDNSYSLTDFGRVALSDYAGRKDSK